MSRILHRGYNIYSISHTGGNGWNAVQLNYETFCGLYKPGLLIAEENETPTCEECERAYGIHLLSVIDD